MPIFVYDTQEDFKIKVSFEIDGMPGCCGAKIFHKFNVREVDNRGRTAPLTKDTWRKVKDKQDFFNKLGRFLDTRLTVKRRVFVTAVIPSKVKDTTQAYYHNLSTYNPVLDIYKIMVKLKWTRQKSWLNSGSDNTLVSFYKDY